MKTVPLQIEWAIKKFSKFLDRQLISEYEKLKALTPSGYESIRPKSHLFRLSTSLFLIEKAIQKRNLERGAGRHVIIRLIHSTIDFPFEEKKSLSIVIGIQLENSEESLNQEQIIKAIEELGMNLSYVTDSLYHFSQPNTPIKKYILDFIVPNEITLSSAELKNLKAQLPSLLQKRVVTHSPSIFWIQNEEEIMKNILMLSRELTSIDDLPQIAISFEKCFHRKINFKVVVLRVIKNENKSPLLLQNFNSSKCHITIEKTQTVGYFQKKAFKQAEVLRFDLEMAPQFTNVDQSINLYSVRNYIVNLLEGILGPVRDFNGGLILKQLETLAKLKKASQNSPIINDSIIEKFFYSLSPIENQSTLPVDILKETLLLTSNPITLKKDGDLLSKEIGSWLIIVIKKQAIQFQKELVTELSNQGFASKEYTFSIFEDGDDSFISFLYLNPNPLNRDLFLSSVQRAFQLSNAKLLEKSTLRLASANLPLSIDPRIGGDELSGTIIKMLFEGLMRCKNGSDLDFGAAKQVNVSPDQLTYTFHLRSSTWSNGDPVTAFDFEYSWKKVLSPKFSTPFAYFFYPIRNAKLCKEGVLPLDDLGVKALDKKTLQVILSAPTPSFLELTAYSLFSPVHQETDTHKPDWSYHNGNHFVCNGPFKVVKKRHTGFDFIKSPSYWNSTSVKLERIEISQLPSSVSLRLFKNHQIDWLGPPFHPWDPGFSRDSKEGSFFEGVHGQYWISCNTSDSILQHLEIRQALTLAINRKQLTQSNHAYGDPALSLLPNDHSQIKNQDLLEGDPEKSRQLLQSFREKYGIKQDNHISLRLLIGLGDIRKKVADSIALQWKKVLGIECIIEACEWKDLFSRLQSGHYQLGGIMWKPWINDPVYTLDVFQDQKHPVNFSSWVNPTYQLLITEALKERSLSERKEKLKLAEEILLGELPVIPIHTEKVSYLKNPSLKNVMFSGVGRVDFTHSFFS